MHFNCFYRFCSLFFTVVCYLWRFVWRSLSSSFFLLTMTALHVCVRAHVCALYLFGCCLDLHKVVKRTKIQDKTREHNVSIRISVEQQITTFRIDTKHCKYKLQLLTKHQSFALSRQNYLPESFSLSKSIECSAPDMPDPNTNTNSLLFFARMTVFRRYNLREEKN